MKKALLALAALVVILIASLLVVPPMMGGFVKDRVATAVEHLLHERFIEREFSELGLEQAHQRFGQ